MDHVELPKNHTHDPITVRYFCTSEYDNGPFSTYPLRQGWTQADIFFRPNWTEQAPFEHGKAIASGRKSAEDATSFLQNWLYFGLLAAVFGPQLRISDFVAKLEDGQSVITTAKLLEYVSGLVGRLQGMPAETQRSVMLSIDRDLSLAHQVFTFICSNTTLDPPLLLSVAILGDFLALIRNVILWKGHPPSEELVFSWPTGDLDANVLTRQMERDGWCVSQIIRSMRLSPSARYFASLLEVPEAPKPHSACSRFRCVAYQMNWQTYEPSHVNEDCGCDFESAQQDQLVKILNAGKIPLVVVSSPLGDKSFVQMRIIECNQNTSYVAISHVWSDRLGNPQANALPQCQLRHLASLVQQLYGPESPEIPFWIDTICCPVAPRSARDRAIVLMRQTYRDADKVLVLDNYMRKFPALETPVFECFARIYCSGWTSRLWTLQEGVLAKHLFVQFADTVINFTESWLAMVRGRKQQTEFHNLLTFLPRIRGDWALWGSTPFDSIQNAVIALHERFTSVATDEALCLGTLLGMDMNSIVEVPPEQRMKRFWSLQQSYTGEFTFWTGPRLKDPGYRWAPASFLNARLEWLPGGKISNMAHPARLSESGLEVEYPGLIVGSVTNLPWARRFWLRDAAKEWRYWLSCTAPRDAVEEDTNIFRSRDNNTGTTEDQIAVITRSLLDGPALEALQPGELPQGIAAVLATILKRDGDTIYVRIEKTAKIYLGSPASIPAHELEEAILLRELMSRLDQGPQGRPVVSGSRTLGGYVLKDELHPVNVQDWLPQTQRWCLT